MYRDFQFYDSRIVDYTRIGETLTLFCVYGIHEKWRTCFYRASEIYKTKPIIGINHFMTQVYRMECNMSMKPS